MEATPDTLSRRTSAGQPAPWLRAAALPAAVLGYLVLWLASFQISNVYWFLPAGLRFSALWLSPSRRWGWPARPGYGAAG